MCFGAVAGLGSSFLGVLWLSWLRRPGCARMTLLWPRSLSWLPGHGTHRECQLTPRVQSNQSPRRNHHAAKAGTVPWGTGRSTQGDVAHPRCPGLQWHLKQHAWPRMWIAPTCLGVPDHRSGLGVPGTKKRRAMPIGSGRVVYTASTSASSALASRAAHAALASRVH